MSNQTVYCVKLEKEEEALERAPLPGELGQRILKNVSKPAWKQWLDHQTMLINEKKLNPLDKETRQYLAQQTEQYFFGDGADSVAGYVPPSN